MGMTIELKRGKFCPVILCDVCEKPISPKGKKELCGAVYWNESGKAHDLLFTHQGDCYRQDIDQRFTFNEDLDVWLFWLFNRTVRDRKDAEAKAVARHVMGL